MKRRGEGEAGVKLAAKKKKKGGGAADGDVIIVGIVITVNAVLQPHGLLSRYLLCALNNVQVRIEIHLPPKKIETIELVQYYP